MKNVEGVSYLLHLSNSYLMLVIKSKHHKQIKYPAINWRAYDFGNLMPHIHSPQTNFPSCVSVFYFYYYPVLCLVYTTSETSSIYNFL